MEQRGYTLNDLADMAKKMADGLIGQSMLFTEIRATNEEIKKFSEEVEQTRDRLFG